MVLQNDSTTKEKIFFAALHLFGKHGYDNVSVRDLAKEVGVTNPSIYNHYKSKKDILLELYRYYEAKRKLAIPDFDDAMMNITTMPPVDFLMSLDYRVSPDLEDTVYMILSIAARLISTDSDSKQFLIDNLINSVKERIYPATLKLLELKLIEPFDVEDFINILIHFCFSGIAFLATDLKVDNETWEKRLRFLYSSCIKPIQQK